MIKLENYDVKGIEHAIRGMRNPMASHHKSDSILLDDGFILGDDDKELAINLARLGPVHAKYRRMIVVYVDITAPLYWWKEYDTYKVGTVTDSYSTMHKIHAKPFTIDDFSHEHLISLSKSELQDAYTTGVTIGSTELIEFTIDILNYYRLKYINTKDKLFWWQMIQLLPSSYNQKRTVMLSYEVLANIYQYRQDHKLDEWREFCKWIETLPHKEIIYIDRKEV